MRALRGVALAALVACAGAGRVEAAETAPVPEAVDPEAIELLARNMYFEAEGEGRKGMLAVGWVVLNRMADGAFPTTVDGVVEQGCQFAWVCGPGPHEPTDRRAWRQALALADKLLGEQPPTDPTRGSMWFRRADGEDPGWSGRVAPAVRIGNHLFYAKTSRLPRPTPKPAEALRVAAR